MTAARHPVLRRLAGWLARLLLLAVAASIGSVLSMRWLPPLTSSVMVQRYGQALFGPAPAEIHYRWVPYEAIAPVAALAMVAAEDQKFPRHWGFDVAAIEQALDDSAAGSPLRGASTISQQVAKNLYLWSGRSWLRKGLEVWFTVLLELGLPKRRILEIYLNIVELGPQTFGVEAASQRFFGKPAARLEAREAALLAAVLPNPLRYRVAAPSAYVRNRQAWILRQMRQLGGPAYLADL
jgi:monofunctional biosynthetic peptidoglycan transglycosylase